MTPLSTLGFHHVTMVSGNAPRTLRFYRDVLGLGLVKKTVNFDDPSSYHLYFGDETGAPGTLLTFFEWKDAPRGAPGIGGVHHIALGVEDLDAILQWKRRLLDQGVGVSGPINRGYFISLYFKDPDGQILELATKGPGYATDEPDGLLGRSVVFPNEAQLQKSLEGRAFAEQGWPEPVEVIHPAMRITGIHHVSAITDDMDTSHHFYTHALGLHRIKQSVNQDALDMPHHFWAHYDGETVTPRSSMTLFGYPPHFNKVRPGVGQTHHIAFRAKDAVEQETWREHILGMGLRVSQVMDRTYFQSIYFNAPDGLLVEIATDGPGFAVDEPAEQLGQILALPAWLENEREQLERELVAL
jgi:glyoxalase family protein